MTLTEAKLIWLMYVRLLFNTCIKTQNNLLGPDTKMQTDKQYMLINNTHQYCTAISAAEREDYTETLHRRHFFIVASHSKVYFSTWQYDSNNQSTLYFHSFIHLLGYTVSFFSSYFNSNLIWKMLYAGHEKGLISPSCKPHSVNGVVVHTLIHNVIAQYITPPQTLGLRKNTPCS